MIKLVALDMDGTLLTDEKKLPPDFVTWTKEHPQIQVVIASGRQYYTLLDNLAPLQEELTFIAENGGLVFEKRQVLYSNAIEQADIVFCMDKIAGHPGLTPIPCGIKGAYIGQNAALDTIAQADIYYHHLKHCANLLQELPWRQSRRSMVSTGKNVWLSETI